MYVRSALTVLSRIKQIALQRGPRKREEGFQSAVFCPIPIGDSPSSKRMYDVMNVSSCLYVLCVDFCELFCIVSRVVNLYVCDTCGA